MLNRRDLCRAVFSSASAKDRYSAQSVPQIDAIRLK